MSIRLAKTLALLGIASCAFGCAYETDAGDPAEQTKGTAQDVVVSEQDASLVLAFLNDPATDFETLDARVGLEQRAARNLIAHRNGPDGVYPSADDNLYDSLTEVDSVPYVGDVVLAQLRSWSVEHAPLPPEYVEGVELTSEQVTAVVWGVNHAGLAELDVEVGLSSLAAQNLIASAPYASVSAMGRVSQVGPSALTALKNHAVVWAAAMNGDAAISQAGTYDGVTFDADAASAALSVAQTATLEQLRAHGVSSTGANAIVSGRPFATLAQVSGTYGVGPATMQSLHVWAAGN